MAQMNDEMYEVEDMDADISLKEELVEEAKTLKSLPIGTRRSVISTI